MGQGISSQRTIEEERKSTQLMGQIPQTIWVNNITPYLGPQVTARLAQSSFHFNEQLKDSVKLMRLPQYVAYGGPAGILVKRDYRQKM